MRIKYAETDQNLHAAAETLSIIDELLQMNKTF